jgi:PLP dependent protein
MTGSIAHNINTIRQNLPASVRLMVVTKQASTASMREAYAVGIRDFGESRVQAAEIKQQELSDLPDLCWHLIGHLQSNKVRKTIEIFDWIHSVDSLKLAQQIDAHAGMPGARLRRGAAADSETLLPQGISAQLGQKPKICLQVKILPDPDKYGWTVPELMADLPQLDRCQNLDIQGLMTIAPLGLTIPETIACFERARDLSREIRQQPWENIKMTELSMGMSGDYPQAVIADTTIVRIGSIIFGNRI